MIGFAVLIGQYIALGKLPSLLIAILGFLSGFLISASIMILNDYFDIDVDRINAPYRPLVSGEVGINTAILSSIVYGIAGLLFAYILSISNLIIAVLFWILGVLYDWRIKKLGFIGNVIVSLSVAIPFIYGGVSVSKLSLLLIIFSIIAFMSNMGRELIKGIADVKGDRIRGINTIAVKYGEGIAAILSTIFIISAILLSILPYILSLVNRLYIIFIIIADILLIKAVISVSSNPNRINAISAKNNILVAMLIGLVAFIVGSISY